MSYARRTRGTPQAIGDIDAGTVASVLQYASKIPVYAKTITEVIDDPYLQETACRIDQIADARKGYPQTPCAPTALAPGQNPDAGIGLRHAQIPLRYVAFATAHSWVYPATIVAIFSIPFLLGFRAGEGSRRSP